MNISNYKSIQELFRDIKNIKYYIRHSSVNEVYAIRKKLYNSKCKRWQIDIIWDYVWDYKSYDEIKEIFIKNKVILN